MKILNRAKHLGDFIINQRGAMLQSQIKNKGAIKVIGGKQINRYGIIGDVKGFLDKSKVLDENASIGQNAVLVQNIVAHIQNPTDHIQIIGTNLSEKERKEYIILDTINQLNVAEPFSAKFFLALLCSNLLNWYVYRFIFAKAIRTMHFDAPVTDRIPIPKFDLTSPQDKSKHDHIVNLVEQMLKAKEELTAAKLDSDVQRLEHRCATLDRHIDEAVYELYGLTPEEIAIMEGKSS